MRKSILMLLGLLVALPVMAGETDGNKYDAYYKKAIIKSKEKRYAETGGVSPNDVLYKSLDEEDLRELEEQGGDGSGLSIGSVDLKDNIGVESVNIAITSRQKHTFKVDKNKARQGALDEKKKVDIGTVKTDGDNITLDEVKTIIDVKELEIE